MSAWKLKFNILRVLFIWILIVLVTGILEYFTYNYIHVLLNLIISLCWALFLELIIQNE